MLFKTISSHLQGMAHHQAYANIICIHQSRCTKINIQSGVGCESFDLLTSHYIDVIMSMTASLITSVSIFYSTVCSGADQRKHQSPTSLGFVSGIHQSLVNSPGQYCKKCFHLTVSSWGKCSCNCVIFKCIWEKTICSTSCDITLRWMSPSPHWHWVNTLGPR